MKDPEPRIEGRPITVLVYEHVTGGGLAGEELPQSWAVEGGAMRRAIARDFASVPGVNVVMMLDSRLSREEIPGVKVRMVGEGETNVLEAVSIECDYALLIAPETDNILANLTDNVLRVGCCSLGSKARAIRMTGDKARLAHHFYGEDIPSPKTWMIGSSRSELPDEWEGLIVFKPRMGAGSVDTVIVHDRKPPEWVTMLNMAIAQPYLPGQPMSASFIVDSAGRATLLGVGRQRIEIDGDGKISYQGGTILMGITDCPKGVERAINSVNDYLGINGLRGFVGVDYLDDPDRGITVLEINPRPTTSYVGLSTLLGPGLIAGAWLDAMLGPLDSTDWPARLKAARQGHDVSFHADGSIVSEAGSR
jgi:predicted ATP-grasp superfamily ATP-dependent carboligase